MTKRQLAVIFYLRISTHTLARRVTFTWRDDEEGEDISTHTLARRVTRLQRGADYVLAISTHTLARRVTVLPVM